LKTTQVDRATLRRVVRFVRHRLDSKLPVQDIAAVAGMDRHLFERRFRDRTGLTPYDYVIRCRIRRAIRLLARTERGLADIALDAGFACQSHFTHMFRKRTGTTPGAYRRTARMGAFSGRS
jgi:AraC family transcriptional regulator